MSKLTVENILFKEKILSSLILSKISLNIIIVQRLEDVKIVPAQDGVKVDCVYDNYFMRVFLVEILNLYFIYLQGGICIRKVEINPKENNKVIIIFLIRII